MLRNRIRAALNLPIDGVITPVKKLRRGVKKAASSGAVEDPADALLTVPSGQGSSLCRQFRVAALAMWQNTPGRYTCNPRSLVETSLPCRSSGHGLEWLMESFCSVCHFPACMRNREKIPQAEYRDPDWRRVSFQNGEVENGIIAAPEQRLAESHWHRVQEPGGCW